MTKDEIKALALECGFSLKEQPDGSMDLHRHVYNFADAVETFACKEALRTLRIENEQLKEERNRAGVDLRNAVSKAAREERRACARVCDELTYMNRKANIGPTWLQEECAAAIRARGNE